jgi:hypothetical protein
MKSINPSPQVAPVISLGSRLEPLPFARIGRIVGVSPEGSPLVEFEGIARGVPAVTMVAAARPTFEQAAERQQQVVLLFDGGDPLRPIIAGFVAAVSQPAAGRELLDGTLPELPDIVMVDGKRVCIEGKDEIVFRCGESSITLRRNGRIVIKGAYVESHSEGTNRIKGGTVEVN